MRPVNLPGQIVCKYLIMNDLQIIRRPGQSNSIKVNQTDYEGLIKDILGAKKSNLIQLNRTKSNQIAPF
jgi:hypothetical protein